MMRDIFLEPTNASRPGLESQEKSAFPRLVGIFGRWLRELKLTFERFSKIRSFFVDFKHATVTSGVCFVSLGILVGSTCGTA